MPGRGVAAVKATTLVNNEPHPVERFQPRERQDCPACERRAMVESEVRR